MDFTAADALLVFAIIAGIVGALAGSAFGATKLFLSLLPHAISLAHRSAVWVVNEFCNLKAQRSESTEELASDDVENDELKPVEKDTRWNVFDEPTYVRKGIPVSIG